MGRLFFYSCLILLIVIFFLFLPIVIETDAHLDMNRKKFVFAVFLYKKIKLLGGYVATYEGGIALHVSQKKAIILPYAQLNSERKRFSFIKTFKLVSLRITSETGAEYLLPVAIAHTVLRAYFFTLGGEREKIENNLWLTDGDVLRVSLKSVIYFNLFILLKNFIRFIKEKMKIIWQKKMKNSTV